MSKLADYGRHLASLEPPISDEQAMEFARILLTDERMAA
jgi:hypothetical protein